MLLHTNNNKKRPFATFEPVGEPVREWTAGSTSAYRFRLFGAIPFCTHTIYIVRFWYEKYDLSTTDMHPFIHSFNAAIDPPWEARPDFEIYQQLAGMINDWS